MRFIGSKEKLLDRIYNTLISRDIRGKSFFDFFAGTTNVGRYFKKKDYQVFSSDLLYFSYVLQRAYITNNKELSFRKLLKTLDIADNSLFSSPLDRVVLFLDNIEPVKGFVYKNYTPGGTSSLDIPRMYFSDENGQKIDAIRQQLNKWEEAKLINSDEFFVLLACLIETVPFYANISGVYSAFQKKWDPRAVKKIKLRPVQTVVNSKENHSFNKNSVELVGDIDVDILYLDPPYNQRQYAPNYHVLETIAKYDNPVIKGVTGMRDYQDQKSNFCNPRTAIQELAKIANEAKYKTLVLSYNTEGIMPQEEIKTVLGQYGDVELVEFDYARFKSHNNGDSKTKKYIKEQLYILKK